MIPLTCRSHYSLMWGTASVERLCARARQLGYSALALTDTDNLYGLWDFLSACRTHGLKPIVGAEITDPSSPHRAICLVKNDQGYHHLCTLLTRRHQDKHFSLKQAIPPLGRGMVILTRSSELLADWHDQDPCLDLGAALPRAPLSCRHDLCRTARKRSLPMVATPGSFFLHSRDHGTHALVRAIDTNQCLSRLGHGDLAPENAFLNSPEYYQQKFSILPQAVKATYALGERLNFQGPDFGIVMPPFEPGPGRTAHDLLRKKTMEGAEKRYGLPLPPKVTRRIDHELAIIFEKNFSAYFLVVEQIVSQASRTCGRGSGAASIVAYCLRITNVCPIKHNLYFERFLNPGRQDPPDIDIDFAWDERDAILNRVLTRFAGHAAMVASHILFQPRMAVRETARVFGLSQGEIKQVTARLPGFWRLETAEKSLADQIRALPEFKDMDFPDPWPKILAKARALVGCPRYLSVHPGGIVITPKPIDTYVPVETAPKGVPVIQWEKEGTEKAGLVKIDLLGNRSLGVIRDCISSIEQTRKKFDDFQTLDPEDDPATQNLVAQGLTMGCFYIESPAMRLLQKKAKTGDFASLVIHSSIIRPAANAFIQAYLERLHTGKWMPIHPLAKGLLDDTFGIMVFQEDVARAAVCLAGFTHAQADGLRKIMSKKEKHRALSAYYTAFSKGAAAKGVSPEEIKRIWKMILSFSGYSFCKAHSASYARVSFQAAYLKTHYPAQFMAAVISNQGGFYSCFAYVSEARRMGVKILGPDIHKSRIRWQGKKNTLRAGFMAIKGLAQNCMEKIIKERKKRPFSHGLDFFSRVRPQKGHAQALINSGCLDRLTDQNSRAALLWAFYAWQAATAPRSLFSPPRPDIPDLPPDLPMDRLRKEFSTLGFLCSGHPLTLFAKRLQGQDLVKAVDIPAHQGQQVRIAGWLITGKTVRTKQGDPMKFLTFEDDTGIVETVFFPRPYARFCHILDYGNPYILSGTVESEWGAATLTVTATQRISYPEYFMKF